MPRSLSSFSLRRSRRSQRGVALYVVIVFVMLSMLLASWAARGSLFNEIVVGNDADYRRAFEAAQAMLQDAEFDIRGVQPSGEACLPVPTKTDVCRTAATAVYFDIETKDLESNLAVVKTNSPTTGCYKGICEKRIGAQDFWNNKTLLTAMMAQNVGARYGQFTGADAAGTANPLLSVQTAGSGAWYWVEILPYIDPNVSLLSSVPAGSNVDRFSPSRKRLMVYRITAIARGNKPSTEVVLQSVLSVQAFE
ncbi:PilX N-terminal domain-containing pilus assembly protein [Acidovorax sp. CCYZU-2555]|uniref:pilus assembly PilX family protein n=1 Tax=Acidovorax sp. CCYZU-2555 TaxID=2835042 RepID=UPI001BCDF8AA|nr:PilX N-terminal domain-containing pilus assembly protein [Acidovorax sp. CCYZU-2555]MBS7776624.1 pilus assembly protein [Acidovorax sp. CCYZU-2555]